MLTLIIHLRTLFRYGWILRHGTSGLHVSIWDRQGNELTEGTPEYYDLVFSYLYTSLLEYYTRRTTSSKILKHFSFHKADKLDQSLLNSKQIEFDF